MGQIEIYPDKKHEAKAYEVFCQKRFKALMVQKGNGVYSGDTEIMGVFCEELRKSQVVFMPLVVDSRKIQVV